MGLSRLEPNPDPAADEVLVRVEASPINPSDLGLLLGPADLSSAKASPGPVLTASVPPNLLLAVAARLDQSLPVGNEGAGLSQEILAAASIRARIPMASRIESLNAAAAGTIALFEAARQRL